MESHQKKLGAVQVESANSLEPNLETERSRLEKQIATVVRVYARTAITSF